MEDDDLVIFSNEKYLIFLHVLTESNPAFIDLEGIRLDPLALENNLSSDILLYFP